MKITDTLISIPPYISATWDQVISLHMHEKDLVVTLQTGNPVHIPGLEPSVLEHIFQSHTNYIEAHTIQKKQKPHVAVEHIFSLPIKPGVQGINGLGTMLQHNAEHKNLPPIPEEVASKIAMLSKMMPEEDLLAMPPSEEGCRCMYCQIHNILVREKQSHTPHELSHHPEEEHVSDAELHFEDWTVTQIKEKLYSVTNKLEPHEQYTVFLGDPIGCTCGKTNCEHIIAVLRS